jgi:hypothetical protein
MVTDNCQNSFGVSLISPWITHICDSIKTDLYEPLLQSSERNGDGSLQHGHILEHLSRKLFRNTASALDYGGSCSLERFASPFTGQNLRWEAVVCSLLELNSGQSISEDMQHGKAVLD